MITDSDNKFFNPDGTLNAELLERHLKTIKGKIGSRVALYIDKKGYTQEQLAEQADISQGFVAQVIAGQKFMGLENYIKVAKALGLDLMLLLSDKDWSDEQLELLNNFIRLIESKKPTPRIRSIKDMILLDIADLDRENPA